MSILTFILICCSLCRVETFNYTNNEVIDYINTFMLENTNYTIYENEVLNKPICSNKIIEVIQTVNMFTFLNQFNTKVYSFNNFNNCLLSEMTYIFLKYYYQLTEDYSGLVYSGICLPSECKSFYASFLNRTNNRKLFTYINDNYSKFMLYKAKIYSEDYLKKNTVSHFPISLKIIILMFFLYISIRVIFSLYGLFVYYADFSQYKRLTATKTEYINTYLTITERKKKFGYEIYKIFSIRRSFKYLNNIKNKVYDDQNLELFHTLKIISLFGVTLYMLHITNDIYYNNIVNNQSLKNYINNPLFFLIRLGYYSFIFFIMINLSIFTYKLLGYYRVNKSLTLMDVIYFTKSTISKFVIFVFLIFLFISSYKELVVFFNGNPLVEDEIYGVESYLKKYVCYYNPSSLFIPLYLHYNIKFEERPCFINYIFNLSEFYMIVLFLIVFYMLYKIKSLKFEISIIICVLLTFISNSLVMYNSVRLADDKFFTYSSILFDAIKPGQLIFSSFLGVMLGIVYFMHKNFEYFTSQEDKYFPFKFLMKLNKYLFFKSHIFKLIVVILCLFFTFILSNSYYLMYTFGVDYGKNTMVKLILMFETKVISVVFFVIVLMIIYLEDSFEFFKHFRLGLFLCVSRSSTSYILTLEYLLIYLKFTTVMSPNLRIINSVYWSANVFLALSMISTVSTILLELPLRVMIKKRIKKLL